MSGRMRFRCKNPGVNGHAAQDVIGLDLGGTFLKAARVAPDGTLGRRLREPVSGETADDLLSQLARAVRTLEEDGAVPAVGLGIPGIIERRDGCARGVPNLPAIEGLPVGAALEERCGRRAFAANDANAAALAESWLGAGRDVESMLLVTLGTGVGGGLVFDGDLFTGLAGYAGEVGHIQVEPNGVPCGCDSWGCIETIAGAGGWVRRTEEALARQTSVLAGRTLDQKVIVDAARQGDAVALEVLEGTARALGAGIAAVLNLLNLERVVIGGGVSAAGPILLDRIVAEAKLRTFPAVFAGCSFVPAALGSDAGVVGAARVAQLGLRARASA
jgi:glucokinase